ncbi:MAG TPA: NAD(P)-dependent alcohol dehydrogenase [Candidatus Aminicenantes bacterium]|nr:NAD(P)-dependent alcohol dehydrogenase [Candidatus Aminicenantes bacterium]HRY64398.1 NAD(P)-dependent alcohol dehydrogenase [Candidatus Aminicenantes bacterium]HRZ71311.1 NAD(P)-dependent alcohol dehydrogenase [Candidatus Aminicenantes bacterium]
MKAIVYSEFGAPDVLRLEEIPQPEPKRGEILVRVRASSVNFGDLMARSFRSVTPRGFNMPFVFWLIAKMAMGWRKPRIRVLGNEFAGDVVAVGRDVERFKPGDQVFGGTGDRFGAYAEFICLSEKAPVAHKPANLSYEEAAVIPYGARMALCLLRRAQLQPGRRILINGASGGIGSAAVQIAKHLGAEVTAVCGGARLDYVRALGADRAIDYAIEDFTRNGETYDVIFDILGLTPFSRGRHSLEPRGVLLYASFKTRHLLAMVRTSMARGRRAVCAIAPGSLADLLAVKELVEAGHIKAIVDRRFPLEQAAEAHRYVETGRRKGSVAIIVGA